MKYGTIVIAKCQYTYCICMKNTCRPLIQNKLTEERSLSNATIFLLEQQVIITFLKSKVSCKHSGPSMEPSGTPWLTMMFHCHGGDKTQIYVSDRQLTCTVHFVNSHCNYKCTKNM